MRGSAWRRRALGQLITLSRRGTPRLERVYAQLPDSSGLAPGSSMADHERRLLRYYSDLSDTSQALPDQSLISVVIEEPAAADRDLLTETVRSLQLQVWPHWQVCACLPAGVERPAALVELEAADPDRIRWAPPAATPAERNQAAAALATGDYVTLLSAGDRLYPSALAEVARAVVFETRLTGHRPQALYSDERVIDRGGRGVGDPVFKPGWSPILLRSWDYVGALALYSPQILAAAGGPGAGAGGRHELARRAGALAPLTHIPHVLVQRRTTPTGPRRPAPPLAAGDDVTVTVIIPTRDRADLISACLTSVLQRTSHPAFEVIVVDNGTREPAALRVLAAAETDTRVRVLRAPGPFNFARLCNQAVGESAADVVVLLNNDTEVITPDWLTTLSGYASEPAVGAVGPQLRYPDGRIQHAGIAGVGSEGTVHLFLARDPDAPSPAGLATLPREVLAVTGACLAVGRERYLAAGGLDEVLAPNDSGDIDLCLRLRRQGLTSVYAPQAVLLHHESPSRGRSFTNFERLSLLRRWPDELLNDPYLNPNVTRSTRYEPDPGFPIPDVPAEMFATWLQQGLPPLSSVPAGD